MSSLRLSLYIQIPCFNEEEALPATLRALPRELAGIARISVVVIDDGSTDRTVDVARAHGAEVIRLKTHKGLAQAFTTGVDYCLNQGADIIVNFDADHQYSAQSIGALIQPILTGAADVALGARDFVHQSAFRKKLQYCGSWAISRLVRLKIPDAATGFRAFSAEAASRIHVFTRYTYTIETLIQAAYNGDKVVSIPIQTNKTVRPSRLFSHPLTYVLKNLGAVIRLTFLYNPLRLMGGLAILIFWVGMGLLIAGARFYGLAGLGFSFFTLVGGLILDQISVNRHLLERVLREQRRSERRR